MEMKKPQGKKPYCITQKIHKSKKNVIPVKNEGISLCNAQKNPQI